MAAEQGLARSAEEEKILRDIREEKEQLWIEIQVQRLTASLKAVCNSLKATCVIHLLFLHRRCTRVGT